jgi:PAS domain S-box-containing protein
MKKLFTNKIKHGENISEKILNNIHTGILLLTKDLTVIHSNQKAECILELSSEKLLNKKLLSQVKLLDENSTTLSTHNSFFGKAVQSKKPFSNIHIQFINSQNHNTWLCTSYVPVVNKKEELEYLLFCFHEISDNINISEALKKSEEHYKVLTENSPDVIMRFDRNHRHIFVNEAVTKTVPLKPIDFLNKTHGEIGIFPSHLVELWENGIESVFTSGEPKEILFNLDNAPDKIYLEWRLLPEFNNRGEVETVLTIARNITENKTAQEALKKSQNRLEMAQDATSDGIWDLDRESNEMYFSARYFSMLGYNQTEIKHTVAGIYRLLHPDDYKRIRSLLESFLESKDESIEYEMRLKKKDNTYAWILARGKVFKKDKQGKPLRIVGTHVDISLRKKQEYIQKTLFGIANAVNTSRNLEELFMIIQRTLSLIIDTTNCYVALYDEISDSISLPFHKDEKDSFSSFPAGKTLTGHVIKTGTALLASNTVATKMAEDGLIEQIGSPSESWLGIPLKQGKKIIGVFVVQSYRPEVIYTQEDLKILEFVSDQIALAIKSKRDQDDLINNQIRQRRIIEASPDGLIVIDPKGRITEYNSSILELLKTSPERIKSRNFMDFIRNEDIGKTQYAIVRTKIMGYNKNNEIIMRNEEGKEFHAEVSFGFINQQEKLTESYVIIIKNIDERKAYESNLRIAKEKAEESDQLKTAFLTNMSHEIRTPMNAIIGFSELLSRKDITETEKKDFLSHIHLGAETLLHLIDDIIDIAKIESGQIVIHKSGVMIIDLFKELNLLFKRSLERTGKKNIKLHNFNNGFSSEISIYSDHFRLKQIFTNLLSNAIKFTEQGEISFGIKEIGNEKILFYVNDSGIGIEKDKQALIFERFRQGHDSKTQIYGGTGLGLAISKNLTELLGGEIYVNSQTGVGSEFCFSIPLVYPGLHEVSIKTKLPDPNLKLNGKTILIAEDEDSNYILIAESLRRTEAKLIRAHDGLEVVEIVKNNPEINLVLMDIRLPYLSGYEATRIIKSFNNRIPIIAQTAYAMSGEKEQSILEGCDDFIAKPIKISELYTLIGKYLK